jgi:hypothetical protein
MSGPKGYGRSAKVQFDVPLLGQEDDHLCWYASAQMLLAWAKSNHSKPEDEKVKYSVEHNERFPKNVNAILAFARMEGLHSHYYDPEELTAHGMLSLMAEKDSPLWYYGECDGFDGWTQGGHVVVITGIHGNTIHYNDPYPIGAGKKAKMNFDKFMSQLGIPDNPWAFIYAKRGGH